MTPYRARTSDVKWLHRKGEQIMNERSQEYQWVGIDVSKRRLDVYIRPLGILNGGAASRLRESTRVRSSLLGFLALPENPADPRPSTGIKSAGTLESESGARWGECPGYRPGEYRAGR